MANIRVTLFQLPHTRWRRDALQPPQVQHDTAGRDTCGHFPDGGLRCITGNTRGLVGSVLSSQKTASSSSNISGSSLTTTTSFVSRRYTGRISFSSLGAKLLTASSALRAYRNRHLGTLMRCCEAWEPVGKCFDPISFECTDFQGLSQIIENLTPESLAEREAEIRNLLRTQTEKDIAHPLENEDESGKRLCEYWGSTFQARAEGPRHHQFENLLQYVQKAPGDIRWVIDRNEFDELIALETESAPGAEGVPCGACRCAGGLASQFLSICVGRRYYS